ncbi:MAG: succinylglutamate desuccinylase/aspartoacylase family protein [Saprospiraceae bacterium]|nr:succinylglutamate desuccinylase/aspartoacylase family protein [Saprospiraceae bacterium]
MEKIQDRIIGRFTGSEEGPLLVCLAGVHGNEPAGVKALDLMFKMLEVEPITNPSFSFRGRFLGLKGNLQAIRSEQRFIRWDLNRMWKPELIRSIMDRPLNELVAEERELRELLTIIRQEISDYQPERLVLLDLHTTTAHGGIFCIATDDPESIRIAIELHAPVITGFLRGIQGTTLHYFNNEHFEPPTVAVCFESGQHYDNLSVNRAIAAITNCMRIIGCVRAEDVENRHDELLIEYARNLPKLAELVTAHRVRAEDGFKMMPDYKNFQRVKKGEILAYDKRGPIRASADARILMPLYQKQGDDGFFLIRPLEEKIKLGSEKIPG